MTAPRRDDAGRAASACGVAPFRVRFVTNEPAPYRAAQMSRIAALPGLELEVFYTEPAAASRNWSVPPIAGARERRLPGLRVGGRHGHLNRGLDAIIRGAGLVLLGGYEQPTYQALSLLAALRRTPTALLFDGIAPSRIARVRRPTIKFLLKRHVVRRARACFANGRVSRDYFVSGFGVPESRIFNQFLAVDVSAMRALAPQRPQLRSSGRQRLGLPDDAFVLGYSGRVIERKRVGDLVQALAALSSGCRAQLVVLGGGEAEAALRAEAAACGVATTVTGFLADQSELQALYPALDALALVSEDEPWGLVVNEALASGLPVVVSDDVGAAPDLVVEGSNGFVVPVGDVEVLADRLGRLAADPALRAAFGRRGEALVAGWTHEASAASFARLLDAVRPERAGAAAR